MKNNNGAAVRRLSSRSLKNNRLRNLFAVLAIILTSMLFTAVFSLLGGVMQVSQESMMHEVGGRSHAGLKAVTTKQYEKIIVNPLVKKNNYNILIGFAENILKRQAEVRYMPSEEALADYFITLQEGHLPTAEDEIIVDTFVMDECKVPHKLGEKIPLTIQFQGETLEKEFRVSGWYEGDSISHASELFVSEQFWMELKGERTDDDFKAWSEKHPDESGAGLMSVNLFFDNASNIEKKVRTVIEEAGYKPETEVDYGVNWAYMGNRLESVDPLSILMIAAAVFIILVTGYLIIYNIFQISVMSDIRFYGLLKTIGTTKKQLRRLIMRQAMLLSVIGIPMGLLLGYAIGKVGLPFMMSFMNYGNIEISLKFNLEMLLFGVAFSVVTVFLSCWKPGRVAGSVSPVEAVKYTEGMESASYKNRNKSEKRRKVSVIQRKHRHRSFSLVSMAFANLGRNKKKTGVVVAAISLSVILLTLVMTGVGSFRLEQFLEQRIAGDIMIGSINVFSNISRNSDYELDSEYVEFVEEQEGIQQKNEMWIGLSKSVKLEEKGKEQFQRLDSEGKLRHDEYTEYGIKEVLEGEGVIDGYIYGYTDGLLKNMKVLEGSVDIEKFQSGNYILLTRLLGTEFLEAADSLYHPGDVVTVSSITEASKMHEVKNESGETIDVWYDNRTEKEYEVMAIVDLPYSMGLNQYSPNGMDAVLPLKEFAEGEGINNICFARSYQIEEAYQEAFEAAVKDYTQTASPFMGYASKQSLKNEFAGMVQVIATIGIVLASVIAFIGILNFMNAVFTGIISRKREFAMLQSIGMTGKQLRNMLICEGVSYVVIAGVISFFIGSILARVVLSALNSIILFFEYKFQILPFIIMIPILAAVAVLTPIVSFCQLQKHSIVERLREAE